MGDGHSPPQSNRLAFFHGSQQLSSGLSANFFAYHMRLIGGSVAILGILTAVAHVIPNVLQPVWGRASDRSQKRVFWLVSGAATVSIGLLLMAFTEDASTMLLAVIIHAIGLSMVTPVWNGLVTDMHAEKHRALAFARLGQIGLIANLAGSLAAGLILVLQGDGGGFARGFALAGLVNLLGLLALFQLSRESRSRAIPTISTSPPIMVPPSPDMNLDHPSIPDSEWKSFLHSQWAYILVMSIIWPLLPLTMLDVMGLSEIQVVVFVVVGQLSTLAWQPLVPGMLEKAHGIRLIRRARLFIALIPIAYAAATFWPSEEGFWLLLIVQVACGQPVAVMNIAAPTVVSSASPRMERARRFGVHNAGIGIAALVGSSAAGIAVDSIMGYGTSLEEILVWVYLLSVVLRFSVAWFGFRVEVNDSPRVTDVLPVQ